MRISFKKTQPKITPRYPVPTPLPKKKTVKKPIAKTPVVKKPVAPKPAIGGERIEKKITPGGMYKIKNKYGADGSLISTDTSRTAKGMLRGAIKKGKVSRS
jgi:hypothetical protein